MGGGIERVPADVATQRVRAAVERAVAGRERLRVLDAGCGADSRGGGFPVPAAFERAHVVGVDVAEDALRANPMLDERIVGDLESVGLPNREFDVVVCWDVLEHLPRPLAALRNLAGSVAPGGTLVVGVPNVRSVKGLVTKLTPLRFHRLVYRRVFAAEGIWPDGYGPFRTYLRWSLAPARLKAFVEGLGFDTELAVVYGFPPAELFSGRPELARAWQAFAALASAASLGALDPEATEAVFAFRAPVHD